MAFVLVEELLDGFVESVFVIDGVQMNAEAGGQLLLYVIFFPGGWRFSAQSLLDPSGL